MPNAFRPAFVAYWSVSMILFQSSCWLNFQKNLGIEIENAAIIIPPLKTEKREWTDKKRKMDEELRGLQKLISKKVGVIFSTEK